MDAFAEHERRVARLAGEVAAARSAGSQIGLAKPTSNLFRHRDQSSKRRINVREFRHVLRVDAESMLADVEGMTTYEEFAAQTLRYGVLPTVAPQLKTITVGGAVSGIGIESSSFRYGLVHETVEEMEVLLGDGRVVVCSPERNADLFHGFPNSYGTLGYALRLKVRLIPARQYVRVSHERHAGPAGYFARMADISREPGIDYLDGAVFSGNEMYVTTGVFTDEAPYASHYTYMGIYYKSIRRRKEDWLTASDYIWRWDTDWFWCSRHFHVQNPFVRALATPRLLNSRTYQRIMRAAQRIRTWSDGTESVIQDVDIPVEHAAKFLDFLLREIRITPIWICPIRAYDPEVVWDLYALDTRKLYINFGFWDSVPSVREDGYFNRLVEQEALRLCGRKGLYSTAWYDEETFWKLHNRPRYDELKRKYDPDGAFPDLYDKCVRRK